MDHHPPDLLILLNDVGRMLRTVADRRARAHGMSRAQWVMLGRLERTPGMSQKELAEVLEVEPITVARLVDRLEARNLVERRADPTDRRVWRLHLLPDAQPVLAELSVHRDDLIDMITARLDPAVVGTVMEALASMRCALSRRPELEGRRLMSQSVAAPNVTVRDVPAKTAARSRLRRPALMLGGVVVVALGGLYAWLAGGRFVSIDNAYVRADKLALATDVSGIIAEVPVHEGQVVHAGDILFKLDDRKFQIALQSAKADLAQTGLQLEAAKHDYLRMLRDVAAKQAQVASDQARFDRTSGLVNRGDVSRQAYDDARYQLAADQQAVASAQVAAQVQLAKLGGDANAPIQTMPSFLKAQAAVDEAQRELDHSTVRAPMNGVVTGVDNAQPGLNLAASNAAFGLVSTDSVWIEANPKETELTHVKPGDPVDVTVDTYPGRTWHGVVAVIAPASGSEFSILPAQNSSGNWVKVVQRITVRIRIDRAPADPPLRAGMSVEADIDTGHTRSVRDLL